MAFDVAGARAAGYSDQEIANFLAQQQPNFNINQARAAGYNDTELVNHLTGPQAAVTPAAKVGSANGPDDPGIASSIMIGGGHAVDKLIDGMAQAYLGATGATDSTKAALKASVDEKNRIYTPLQDAHPVATGVGEALPSMVVPVGGAATALGTAGRLALQGGLVPALQYGSVSDRAANAGIGAAASVIGGTVIPAVGRAVAGVVNNVRTALTPEIDPAVAALAQQAQSLGIPVTRAQLSDSQFVKTLASQIEKIPLTGGTAARATQQDAFNQAVSRTIGEDTPTVNQATYNAAKTRIGQQFEDLSNRNNLRVTPALVSDVGGVLNNVNRYGTPDQARVIGNLVDDLQSRQVAGQIPGPAYQAADSQMSALMKSGDPTAQWIGQLRDAVRTGMDHSISPEDQAAWMEARSQYRNLKAIRDIIGKAGVDGDISPALLMGRMNSTGASREAMAMGDRGDLGTIAQIGKQFVQDRVPNSGTAQRLVAASVLGGGAGIAGLPAAVGMGVTAATTGRMLNGALNTGASGVRALAANTARGTAAAPTTLADLLREVPTENTQKAGSLTGLTLADMLNR